VAETQEAGACVREVAARHDVYPSLLHNWRRQYARVGLSRHHLLDLLRSAWHLAVSRMTCQEIAVVHRFANPH
jgi:transposase-like protein